MPVVCWSREATLILVLVLVVVEIVWLVVLVVVSSILESLGSHVLLLVRECGRLRSRVSGEIRC